MPRDKEYAKNNPHLHAEGGSAHESTVSSTESELSHAQSDDALQDVPPPQDPNISGTAEMNDLCPWEAGSMDSTPDNNDYRARFPHEGMLDVDGFDHFGIGIVIRSRI